MANPVEVDPAFSGLSQKPGLDIWRISDGHGLIRLDAQQHGSFFTGDAYLVLKVMALRSGGVASAVASAKPVVHYWLGKNATKVSCTWVDASTNEFSFQADARLAAAKAMDLDMALGSKSIGLLREPQGHESDLFLSYFRPFPVLPITGANGVPDPEASKGGPRLWQVKGDRFVHVRQVPSARTSLAHSCVYVLSDDKKVFQFNGASCDKQAKCRGLEVAQVIRERAAGASVAVVEDNDMTTSDAVAFWDHFGGFAPIPKRTTLEDDVEQKPGPVVLSWVSANGSAEMARGTELQRKLLEASRCIIVDMGPQVFVWRGRTSTLEDRRAAAMAAEAILAGNRPFSTRIVFLNERSETADFRELFSDWHGAKAGPEGGASTKLKANLRSASLAHGPKPEPLPPLLPDGPADVKVWRLNGKERVMLGPEEVGIFYSGDCYLVQFVFTRGRRQEHILFLWAGRQSTAEERSLGVASAERMADTRGSHTTLIRVIQGREPAQFFSHLRCNLFFFQGGHSATYRAVLASEGGPARKHPVLLLVKPLPEGHFLALQMPLAAKSLNSSDCFLLMTHSNPILWTGGRSREPQLAAAQAAAEYLRPGMQPRRLVEGKETTVFWGHLGGKSEYPPTADTRDGPREPRLFQVLSVSSNPLKVKEVPGFKQEDLFMEDTMILDSFQEVFLWLGSAVPEAERREAFAAGLRYVEMVATSEGRSRDTTVVRVAEGNELPMFIGLFDSWQPIKLGVHLDPYTRQLAILNGTSLEELEAQHMKQAPSQSHDTGLSQRASAFAAIRDSIASASSSGRGSEERPSPLQSQTSFSQRQAALAALQSSLEKPQHPLRSPSLTSPPSRSTTDTAFSSSEASPAAAAPATPIVSSQQAAAMAALRATLGEKDSDGTPSAPPSHANPRLGATQDSSSIEGPKSAAVAALMEGFQAEQSQLEGSKGHGARGTPQGLHALAAGGEEGGLTSPPSQRAAAMAALQSTLSPQEGRSASASPRGVPGSGPEAGEQQEEGANGGSVDESICYPLERLRVSGTDPAPGIDTTRRESYLSSEEFVRALGLPKSDFYKLPKWKQDQRKQSAGTSAGAMRCFARALDLKDDPKLIAEYLEYHKSVWPEVLENIKASGIEQMRIFVLGTRLFMYCEVPDDFNPSGDYNENANSPRAAEWEKLMMAYQQRVPSADPAASGLWTDMELCFDLKEQLSRQQA